ncbi:MAG: hypothetical protein K8S13_20250 [Desulfobacula sp.]|uniref:hypothetical protein n=1 Tax=Desulfobacula sp. TaxID=2593537 RepID=UPI0025C4F606|nr:hypothetical protein [Desulfobacula sp.]MCD4722169.1 hypothetical protein [Desulfobacula sp.]
MNDLFWSFDYNIGSFRGDVKKNNDQMTKKFHESVLCKRRFTGIMTRKKHLTVSGGIDDAVEILV